MDKETAKLAVTVDFPTPPFPDEIAIILEMFSIFLDELKMVFSFSEITTKLTLTSILKSILFFRESIIFLFIVFLA